MDNINLEAPPLGQTMTLDRALPYFRAGYRLSRSGWNGPGQFIELQVPDEHSKMSLPYVFIQTVDDNLVPSLCSQTDFLASDWYILYPSLPEPPD